MHESSQQIDKISHKTVWSAIVMLFFSSLFPYTTKLISTDFNNKLVQVIYGIVILLITFSVMWYYSTLVEVNNNEGITTLMVHRKVWIRFDIIIKIIGLILSVTIYPPAMSYSIFITLIFLVIPNQFKN